MTVPVGLRIAPAHFLAAPEEEYRNCIEGDNHKHFIVKIDDVKEGMVMKQYGSFSKVEDRFSFETSNLKNKRFCFITTATYLDLKCYKWKLRRGGKPKCKHATAAKSFMISRKVKACPHVNGALSLRLFCDHICWQISNNGGQ